MTRIESFDALDFRLEPGGWDFAETCATEIAAHWQKRHAAQPHLFNGRVLMLKRSEARGRTLAGAFVETDFSAFLAWRECGWPASDCRNGFAMAALRSADGAFVLGEMSALTASAGAIYFPAGTPDLQDVFDGHVDLDASARRELFEETGLPAEEVEIAPGWDVVTEGGRVACMKPMRAGLSAEGLKARIEANLAAETRPEFCAIHLVRNEADFTPAMPAFVRDYMRHVLG